MSQNNFEIISPIDLKSIKTINYASIKEIKTAINTAKLAQLEWSNFAFAERYDILTKFCEILLANTCSISKELTLQMGRPISQTPFEIKTMHARASYMLDAAKNKLENLNLSSSNEKKYIVRNPAGVVLIVAPWNYPYLTTINSLIPALIAGNSVILKMATQTALCAQRFTDAMEQAGVPNGVFQALFMQHEDCNNCIKDGAFNIVNFTGSNIGGKIIHQSAAYSLTRVNLELGGKDAAIVLEDADIEKTSSSLVDGAFFNSGQSCCGIERIYVNKSQYDNFVESFINQTKNYIVGDPLDEKVSLGPVVSLKQAEAINTQVANAIASGATDCLSPDFFNLEKTQANYLTPRVLTDVDHNMDFMNEETFGPTVGIMAVEDADEAIQLANDSKYGLTASVWTQDLTQGENIATKLQAGTVFVNRCDFLDPALTWSGLKNSGVGYSLSEYGFETLTQPKSFYIRSI